MPDKWLQLSANGGLLGNYRFIKLKAPGLSIDVNYNELGAYAGFSADLYYALFEASGYLKIWSVDIGGVSVSTNVFGLDFGLYGKYPFRLSSQLTLYPLAGAGYDMNLYSNATKLVNDYLKFLDIFYLRVGGGLNYDIMPRLHLNAKLLYNIFLYNESASKNDVSLSLHGPSLSVGVNYLF